MRDRSKTAAAKPAGKKQDKYEAAEEMRKKTLTFLAQKPGATTREVSWHLKVSDERASQVLMRMEQLDEVTRTKDGESPLIPGLKCAAWFAATQKTFTAAEIKAHLTGNLKSSGRGRKTVRAGQRRAIAINRSLAKKMVFGGLSIPTT